MIRTLVILIAILAGTAAAAPGEPDVLVLVQLKGSGVEVRADDVRLGDIASIDIVAASDARRRSAGILAENAIVARFASTSSMKVEAGAIRRALVRAGFSSDAIDLQGPAAVTVSRRMMTLSAGRIRAAVRRHVRDVLGEVAEGAAVRIVGAVRPVEVPVARWRLRLAVSARDDGARWLGRVPVDVAVEVDGRTLETVAVTVVVDRAVSVVRAVKRISRGQPISRDEVALEEVDAAGVSRDHFTSIDAVVGLVAVDGFTRGQALTRREVRARSVIRKGDLVTARVRVGSLVVEATCLARMDGAPGDRIVLENVDSKRAVRGVVVDAKNVDVLVNR